ncbi:MAG: glycosyltransferase [Bacteroidota bacterium]
MHPFISAIIVAVNEEACIRHIIHQLRQQDYQGQYEIILADGGSTDQTIDLAREDGIVVCSSPQKGKASQMNAAARIARGELLFFVHADMTLSPFTLTRMRDKLCEGYDGGGFANSFETHNDKIKQLGNWFNFRLFDRREQSDKGIFYGDNGIFVKKNVFEALQGFKEIPIMEDYDFSFRLHQSYRSIKIYEPEIIVSARRHIQAGFLLTRFQWVMIKKLYQLGVSPFLLARWYRDIR